MRVTQRFYPMMLVAVGLVLMMFGLLPAQQSLPESKVMVADVIIQGSQRIRTDRIMAMIKTHPETEFRETTVQDDVRKLVESKLFRDVKAQKTQIPDGRVVVTFLVVDFSSIVEEVVYKGSKHTSQDELEKLTGIRKGTPLNPSANKKACEAIVRKLNDDGRPFAACDLLSGDKPGDSKVIFNITEGPKANLRSTSFSGNEWAQSGRLASLINSKKMLGIFPTKYNSLAVDADISKIEEYYKGFGFLSVKVSRELRLTEDGRDYDLIFHVIEGPRYTVQMRPQIIGSKSVPPEQLDQLVLLKPGEFYSQAVVDGDKNKLQDYIGYNGQEARAEPVLIYNKDNPGFVTVNYEIAERPPVKVGQVFIAGNSRTKQNVILRQVPLYPGQTLTYPDLRQSEKNLARLGIFESSPDGQVKPTITIIDQDSARQYKDILITVQEANTGSLVFGVGVNSNAGLTGNITLNERNFDILRLPTSWDDLFSGNAFRGAGQEFQVQLVPGTQLQRYTVSWREPFLFDTPISLSTSAYYWERSYNEYTEEREGIRVTLGRKLTNEFTLSGGVRVENVNVSGVVPFAPPAYLDAVGNNFQYGPRIAGTYDTRDSYLRATSGTMVEASYEEMFGDHIFPLINLTANNYWTTFQRPDGSGKQVISLRSQVGFAGYNTPVYERFFAGGINSIRGFQFRGVGPDVNGFKTGGDFMLLNSLEYQVPVLANDQVFVVGFIDSGTVESKVDITDYRVTAGFGFRFVVPMLGPMPIALDFGFPIVKGPADNQQVFSFFMGFNH